MVWKQKDLDKEKEKEFLKFGKHKLTSRILAQTRIDPDKADFLLSTDYKDLNDPFLLNDVELAAKTFIRHAKNKSRVAIIGDYDCDGIVSTTMLYELCRDFNLKCVPFLPSRLEHGYGLNKNTIASFKEKLKTAPDLLFVTDCGTSNKDEIEELKDFGVKDVIIIDHHLPADEEKVSRNATALVSWHLSDNFNEMCACGEVFQFIRGVRKLTNHVNPVEYLSYAAIGTIADSQPIFGDNRLIVKNGLTKYAFDHVSASGLNSLIKSKIKYSETITQTDIEYRIAPMVNAAGRIASPDIALRLLTEYDPLIADELADKVLKLNIKRKSEQTRMEYEAVSKARELNSENGIFVYGKDYHIGIVGIVAARVVEETGKPSLVIGYHNGVWKGSGRSIEGVNLKEILDSCSFMFDKYGGHAAAVGVTIKEEYLEKAQGIFDDACSRYFKMNDSSGLNFSTFNTQLNVKAVNDEIASVLINELSPYCKSNNPEPVFKLSNVRINSIDTREGDGWSLANFSIYKGEYIVPYKFTIFSPNFGNEIIDEPVNVYFTFPQRWDNSKRFQEFSLTAVQVEKT